MSKDQVKILPKREIKVHTGCASLNGKNCPESKLQPEQGCGHVLEENVLYKHCQVQCPGSIFQKGRPQP